MFSDLECDYINPIDLCNKLNQVSQTYCFVSMAFHNLRSCSLFCQKTPLTHSLPCCSCSLVNGSRFYSTFRLFYSMQRSNLPFFHAEKCTFDLFFFFAEFGVRPIGMMRLKFFGRYRVISRKHLSNLGSIFSHSSTICIGACASLFFSRRRIQLTFYLSMIVALIAESE